MNKKIIISLLLVIFSILFSILIVSSSLMFIPTHSNEQSEMDKAVLNYLFNPFISSENISFMSKDEIRHIEDVKSYLFATFTLFLLIGGFLIYTIRKRKDCKQIYRLSSKIIIYFISITLAISLIVGFENIWAAFHYVFFPQGNWMFASDSVLMQLYGGNYFLWLVFSILSLLFLINTIIYILNNNKY